MTDKVQKIREEVQRLQSELIQEKEKGFGSETDDACILELQNVLTYIDFLQEEPVSNNLQTEIEDYINRNFSEGSDGCLISDKNKSLGGVTYSEIGELARHFADWQKQLMMKDTVDAFVYRGGIRLKEWPLSGARIEKTYPIKLIIIKQEEK